MHRIAVILALALVGTAPALAFDAATEAVLGKLKPGKHVPIASVGTLMMGAERWCYNLQDNNCAWSDIYLAVDGDTATYEISNPWSEAVDISFVDRGVFKDGRYICEAGFDWVPSVRAYDRDSGKSIEGRALEALRQDIAASVDAASSSDCFDYVYRGADAAAETVTLVQRQYIDGATDPANDAVVTLYFNAATANGLGWYF